MATLGDLLDDQRHRLNRSGQVFFTLLLAGTAAGAACFALFIANMSEISTFSLVDRFLDNDPGRALDVALACLTFAFGSGVKMWRIRQEKMKTLIAQAFVLEGDTDAAIKLLLGRLFGEGVAGLETGLLKSG